MKRPEVTIEDFKKQAAKEGWNPTPQTLELVGYLIEQWSELIPEDMLTAWQKTGRVDYGKVHNCRKRI